MLGGLRCHKGCGLLRLPHTFMVTQISSASRWPYVIAAAVVLILGWSIRAYSASPLPFIGNYAPDTLWALSVFLLVAIIKQSLTTWRTAAIALAFAYAIEMSQLYQAPWINAIRATRPGGLVLGHGFLWSDLICYTVGIGFGIVFDQGLRRMKARRTSRRMDRNHLPSP